MYVFHQDQNTVIKNYHSDVPISCISGIIQYRRNGRFRRTQVLEKASRSQSHRILLRHRNGMTLDRTILNINLKKNIDYTFDTETAEIVPGVLLKFLPRYSEKSIEHAIFKY